MLPNIIHYNQCAYVKGRTIFDAVRTIEDVMEFSERYNIEEQFLTNFLRLIEDYGSCSGLEINHDKSEILFRQSRLYFTGKQCRS